MTTTRRSFLASVAAFVAAGPVLKAVEAVPHRVSTLYEGRWQCASESGGFIYSDELSDILCQQLPLTKFRSAPRVNVAR
jgi:hypothetical protein